MRLIAEIGINHSGELEKAKTLGFKQSYLETIPELKEAIHIYQSHGFKHLKGPLGDTGHYNCGVWMIKDL